MKEFKGKKWYRSRSIWAGGIGIAVSILTGIDDGLSTAQITLGALSAANILLRALTDEKVIW